MKRRCHPTLGVLVLLVAPAFLAPILPCPPAAAQETCAECHSDPEMFEGTEGADRLVVAEEVYLESIHGQMGFACVDCHMDVDEADLPHEDELAPVDCSFCHEEASIAFHESLHGYALDRGNPKAPDCTTCHGVHDILPVADPESPANERRIVATCSACHEQGGLLTDPLVHMPHTAADYPRSVHGAASNLGDSKAAVCTSCHGTHELRGPEDPRSRIHRNNVATTCGECHEQASAEYLASIHGRALAAGVSDTPTCNDCHGEHLILSPDDPDAATHGSHLALQTCARCHDDGELAERYDLSGGVVGSFVDSYHGWASRSEASPAATCVDCHETHAILPPADPASSVNLQNVVATCGQCHENSSVKFAASYTHEAVALETNPINRFLRTAYLWLIGIVIGGMALHNLLILAYYLRRRWVEHEHERSYLRFDRLQRLQHAVLALSFLGLVVTGFALRFPDAWWVRALVGAGLDETARWAAHRSLAVVLMTVGGVHLLHVVLHPRGRRDLEAMLPRLEDVRHLRQSLAFYLGRRAERPACGRYDYTQKAEYWALVWGTILMVVTGLILWFPARAVGLLPSWVVVASQIVHYYEAWLATLAILVWHFFFVFLHPDEYPMSWTWLSGRLPEHLVRERHSAWARAEPSDPPVQPGPDPTS